MAIDYLNQEPSIVRRKDRAVEDDAWIQAALTQAPMGVLATVHGDQPFLNANLFVYDPEQHVIYIHTAKVGRTRANVEVAEKVCFGISSMGRLLPAEEALKFSVEYSGVMVFGRARIVHDEGEASRSLQLLLDKYAPHLKAGEDYRPVDPEEVKRTTVYRIEIDQWSGKKKKVAADFPGAYWYKTVTS